MLVAIVFPIGRYIFGTDALGYTHQRASFIMGFAGILLIIVVFLLRLPLEHAQDILERLQTPTIDAVILAEQITHTVAGVILSSELIFRSLGHKAAGNFKYIHFQSKVLFAERLMTIPLMGSIIKDFIMAGGFK